MKKLILLVFLVACCSCLHENPNGKCATYVAITKEGDSIEVKANAWEWHEGCVYFYSDDGTQFIRSVRHIILK